MLTTVGMMAMLLVVQPPRVETDSDRIEPGATQRAIAIRTTAGEDWQIVVHDAQMPSKVTVELSPPEQPTFARSVTLTGQTVEDRSRELAVALVLIMEEYRQTAVIIAREPPPDPPQQPEPLRPRGWLGLGAEIGAGPDDPYGGLTLRGGTWLLREFVAPMGVIGWARSADGELTLDGIRFGAGLAGGAPLVGGLLWAGASAIARAQWVRASDQETPSTWTSSTELAGLLQVRHRALFGQIWLGAEITGPPVSAQGQAGTVRWGPVRFVAGIAAGIVLGARTP